MAGQPAPQPVPQGSLEMPDYPSVEEDTDEGFVGYPPLPRGINPQPIPRCCVEPNRGGKGLSRRDWYELPSHAERVCRMQIDMWPHNLRMMHGCHPTPTQLHIWQKCKTFRAKGAID